MYSQLQLNLDGGRDDCGDNDGGLELHGLSVNQDRFREVIGRLFNLANEFVGCHVPLSLLRYLVLAAHFPNLHIQHDKVKKGAHLILVIRRLSDVQLFLQYL